MSEVVFEVSEVTGLQCHGLLGSRGEVSGKGEHVRANMFVSERLSCPYLKDGALL